jgi:two-component system heavy metal sensor histidine kinase CusS
MDDPHPRAMAHDNHPMETRAWRLIMLPLGKRRTANRRTTC